MYVKKDFYELLSDLFKQMAQDPDVVPAIPLNHWQEDSIERRLLEDFQTALVARQGGDQKAAFQGEEKAFYYRNLFKNASDGLVVHDIETGQVVEINEAACTLYGGLKDAFLDQPFTRFVHPESSHQFEKYIKTVQAEGFSLAQQIHQRQDGSPFYVEISGAVITVQSHAFILSSVRDATQRVHSEQLLH
jgi:PAS domain S-box-containing protein